MTIGKHAGGIAAIDRPEAIERMKHEYLIRAETASEKCGWICLACNYRSDDGAAFRKIMLLHKLVVFLSHAFYAAITLM